MAKTTSLEAQLDELAYKSMTLLDDYFTHPAKHKDVDFARAARMASSVLQAWTRSRATESQQETLRAMVARELAADKSGTFRQALLAGGPHSALPSGGKK